MPNCLASSKMLKSSALWLCRRRLSINVVSVCLSRLPRRLSRARLYRLPWMHSAAGKRKRVPLPQQAPRQMSRLTPPQILQTVRLLTMVVMHRLSQKVTAKPRQHHKTVQEIPPVLKQAMPLPLIKALIRTRMNMLIRMARMLTIKTRRQQELLRQKLILMLAVLKAWKKGVSLDLKMGMPREWQKVVPLAAPRHQRSWNAPFKPLKLQQCH